MKKNSEYRNILLTGASGQLGQAIINSGIFPNLLCPPIGIFDLKKPNLIENYFKRHKFDTIIHCAALARMSQCEENPIDAIETNIIGTANLVKAVIRKEVRLNTGIRFIHISTDGVYSGINGNYSENNEVVPYNKYGWTKLAAECSVNMLSDFCIIRTSFFDPKKIKFAYSASDSYSSKVTIDYLVKAVLIILKSRFIGTINIGDKRQSDYLRYREFKKTLKPCKRISILKNLNFKIAKDASLNLKRWRNLLKKTPKDNGSDA